MPRSRVLDYSHALQRELKLPVLIINDSLTAFVKNPALEPSFDFNHLPTYNEVSSLTYKGETFAFKQVPANIMPNVVPTVTENTSAYRAPRATVAI